MHVMQLILVKADTAAEAMAEVGGKMNEPNVPEWGDWHNAIEGQLSYAGRWTNLFGEEHPDYLSYGDDPERAEQFISDALNLRMAHYEDIRQRFGTGEDFYEMTQAYNPYDEGSPAWTIVWNAKRLANILENEWTSDSAIYDIENYTACMSYFRKDVVENPTRWWLIPVDFHF